MATTHFERVTYKSGVKLAVGRITYITGAQASVSSEARIEHQGLAARTRQPREDVVEWRHKNLPSWAVNDPITFFRAAEKYEGAGRVAYTEWRLSLPRELGLDLCIKAAHDFLDTAFTDRNPCVWAIHNPSASDGLPQTHLHVIFSMRIRDGIDRSPSTYFRWYNAKNPECGGAQKDPLLNRMGAVFAARQCYCDIMNAHLERHGHAARLNPHRLEARGFARVPEPRLKPADSNELKFRQRITEAMAKVFAHRDTHAPQRRAEQLEARAYWIRRKQDLGITKDMSPAEQLKRIAEARAERVMHPPKKLTPTEAKQRLAELSAEEAAIVRLANALRAERRIEEQYAAQGKARPQDGKRRLATLFAEASNHKAPRKIARETSSSRLARSTKRLTQQLSGEGQHGTPLHVRVMSDDERRRQRELSQGHSY